MAEGKWISGLTATMSLREAAHQVLAVRLRAVRSQIPLAVRHAHQDVEHVHQLRVATRRCRAAIDLFGDCLPRKLARRLGRELRDIRRAAGAARDCDVFLEYLQSQLAKAKDPERAGLHALAGEALAARARAQEDLVDACTKHERRLERAADDALWHLREPHPSHSHDSTLGERAGRHTFDLVRDLELLASDESKDYERLHQVRIQGKRLRYAMEIFADCFPPEFRSALYQRVEEMQAILGLANDSHMVIERVTELRDQVRAFHPALSVQWQSGLESYLRSHRRRLGRERERFVRFWKAWQADGVQQRFEVLSGPLAPLTDAFEPPAVTMLDTEPPPVLPMTPPQADVPHDSAGGQAL